jgi:hypothetical protein
MNSDPQGVTVVEDVVRREVNRAKNERQHAWEQKVWLKGVAQATTKAQGEETPSELESSGERGGNNILHSFSTSQDPSLAW